MPGMKNITVKPSSSDIMNIISPFFLYPLMACPKPGIMNDNIAFTTASHSICKPPVLDIIDICFFMYIFYSSNALTNFINSH